MPTYTYKCSNCQRPFEIVHAMSNLEEPLPNCQYCGSKNTYRVIANVFAILGKGSLQRFETSASGCGSCSSSSAQGCGSCKH